MFRTFHLTDLPKDEIRILLPQKLTEFLINEASKIVIYRKLLTPLLKKRIGKNISPETIRCYINRTHFIPLWFLLEIINLLKENRINLNLDELERKVIALRGPRGTPIYKPRFPWKEDERIVRIVFHLMGDGHGGGDISKGRVPAYFNTNKVLIDEFKKDLQFFGKVPTREYKRERENNALLTIIEFPKVVGHLIRHLYNVKIVFPKTNLSSVIFLLPRSLLSHGIRAFFDDEGSVKSTELHVYSANKRLLQGLKKLMNKKFPEFKKITQIRISSKRKSKCYYFAILSPDLENYSKLISFLHPEKLAKLKLAMQIQNRKWLKRNFGETRLMILNSIIKYPKTSYEIAKEVGITQRTVNKYLNGFKDKGKFYRGLIEESLAKPLKKVKEGFLVTITKEGKEVLITY